MTFSETNYNDNEMENFIMTYFVIINNRSTFNQITKGNRYVCTVQQQY